MRRRLNSDDVNLRIVYFESSACPGNGSASAHTGNEGCDIGNVFNNLFSSGFKIYNPKIDIIGVEPPAQTRIQGLRNMEAYKPPIYDDSILDCKLDVPDEEAFILARELYVREGLTAGISCGAALWGALRYSEMIESGNIVMIFPDRGDKYFSTELFQAP